ncbi:MAG: hypothetical protein K8F92_01495 [Hyphomicrobium sp.]|uniref:hypothetical protein n=1 Tax=Hyphomicrobium sp. TaxID=82 RepID=UPI00132869DD|nr:hypothetical protein [Hyphomicrobium sp.]KAB2939596.1 MAG: hypothetical protein F9K20_16385 [Hyphomicrobium sp.]MBZ0208315.1 hypothetical protein [Hyphomicrobium sp.]
MGRRASGFKDVTKHDTDQVYSRPEEPGGEPEPTCLPNPYPETRDGDNDMADLHSYLASLPAATAVDYAIELLDSSSSGLDAMPIDTIDIPDDSPA